MKIRGWWLRDCGDNAVDILWEATLLSITRFMRILPHFGVGDASHRADSRRPLSLAASPVTMQ